MVLQSAQLGIFGANLRKFYQHGHWSNRGRLRLLRTIKTSDPHGPFKKLLASNICQLQASILKQWVDQFESFQV